MARKRSLKDAAADRLVGSPDAVAAATAPAAAGKPNARRRAAQTRNPAPADPDVRLLPVPAEAPQKPIARPKMPRSLLRIAVSILIGFVGGYVFGRYIRII